MSNFRIHFAYPWLLLLLIPAIFFALLPYFRLSKKYRRTRNRVVSFVLHTAVIVMSVCLLAGMTFRYQVPNSRNEVILLVDVSDSGARSEEDKNAFVRSVIDGNDLSCRLGIVTFGYDQVYAAELSDDSDGMYEQYLRADRPNTSGTDMASALRYASRLFTNPESAKIILLSDGAETDGAAASVIRSVVSEGISVYTVYFPEERSDSEVQIVGAALPDYNVAVGDTFTLKLSTQSSLSAEAAVTLYDNGVACEPVSVRLTEGTQTVELEHSFAEPGLHELRFSIGCEGDRLTENNIFCSYMYLESFDDILILERTEGESSYLAGMLKNDYNVTVAEITDKTAVPATVDELRQYDEVVLVNIANADMPAGFDELLYEYVKEYGGGLFTVGGNKTDPETGETVANTYNRGDMYGTLYQEMLPVEAIEYTPPIGVMLVIDRSGSMQAKDETTGKTILELAKEAAKASLHSLSDRDYCGVMTLENTYNEEIEMTPVPQKSRILAAIDSISDDGGGTMFAPSLKRAGDALKLLNVEKRHIIMLTDGMAGDAEEVYGEQIRLNAEQGITLSIVGINAGSAAKAMKYAAEELGGGRFYDVDANRMTELTSILRHDLTVPEITDVNYETFTPQIDDHTSAVNGILQSEMPTLDGFYGTKVKTGASYAAVDTPLMAAYVPVYAQWKFGKGSVGSFMCDLSGVWSADFVNSPVGVKFIFNVVNGLFPTQNIEPQDIEVKFTDDNFTSQLSIFTELLPYERVDVTVTGPPEEGQTRPNVQSVPPSAAERYSRTEFVMNRPGIYTVLIEIKDGAGNVASSRTVYKAFSYSKEYNAFPDGEADRLFLERLAADGDGKVITDAARAYDGLKRALDRETDPATALAVAAVVLFLLDIAVRKFKFKWLHEIVRERKNGKYSGKSISGV